MNSKQRILAAMNHEEPDRVPVMCQLALGDYFLNCSFSPSEIWFDSETFAKALVDLQKRYGFDGILVNIAGRPQHWRANIRSSQRINNVEHIHWESGLETVIPPNDNPQTYQPGQTPLERADYRSVNINDPATYRLPGYVWNTWHMPELWDIDPQADLSDLTAYPYMAYKCTYEGPTACT